jgi:hypothetical protein
VLILFSFLLQPNYANRTGTLPRAVGHISRLHNAHDVSIATLLASVRIKKK